MSSKLRTLKQLSKKDADKTRALVEYLYYRKQYGHKCHYNEKDISKTCKITTRSIAAIKANITMDRIYGS